MEDVKLSEELLIEHGFVQDYELQSFFHRTFVKGDIEIIQEMNEWLFEKEKIKTLSDLLNVLSRR